MTVSCITGGRGFIGRHLARQLAYQEQRVVAVGHGAWPTEDAQADGIDEWVGGDVSEANLSTLAGRWGTIETLYHLAGGSAVGPSFAHPYEDFERTVATTARLLDWLRQHSPATRLVVVSTAAVYGSGHDGPIAEDAARHPASPYGVHKHVIEQLVGEHARSFGIRSAIVRPFSVYGTGLKKQFLFDLCRRCERLEVGAKIPVGGTGYETRDWLHVDDAVALLTLVAGTASTENPVFNGGTGRATSVGDVAAMICDLWGKRQRPVFSGEMRPGDPHSLVANIDKARSIGFVPHRPFEEGLAEYVDWLKTQLHRG